jgi:hypothetical protein
MWPSTRSNGPGVVCHRIRVDSEGKVAAVEDVETERILQQTSQRLGPCRRRTHARACLRLACLTQSLLPTDPDPARPKQKTTANERLQSRITPPYLFYFISFIIIIICIHFCSCSAMVAQSLRSSPPSTYHQHILDSFHPSSFHSHLWKFSPFFEQCLAPLQQLEQRYQLCFSALTQALQYCRINLPSSFHSLPR